MTPILILVAFLALAAGYFAGRFTTRAAADARSAELQRTLQDMQTQKAVAEARLQAERVQAAETARLRPRPHGERIPATPPHGGPARPLTSL